MRPGGLSRVLSDPRRTVIVGLLDEVVVGLATARAELVGETSLGVIDAFYVEPDARGIGVGRAMLDALVSWLGAKGCRAVDVERATGATRDEELLRGGRVQGAPDHHAQRAFLNCRKPQAGAARRAGPSCLGGRLGPGGGGIGNPRSRAS